MASGSQLRSKTTAVLTKLQATPRVVQFRQVTQTGGDSLLGIGGTETVTLTSVSAQPAVEMVQSEEIAGASGLLQPGDWRFTFDGSIAESVLRESQILYGTEILNIVHVEPYALNGIVVAWNVIGRTVQTR